MCCRFWMLLTSARDLWLSCGWSTMCLMACMASSHPSTLDQSRRRSQFSKNEPLLRTGLLVTGWLEWQQWQLVKDLSGYHAQDYWSAFQIWFNINMYPRKYQDNDCSQFLFVLLLQYIEPLSDGGGLYLVLCTVLCINVCFVEHAFVLNASFFVRQTKQLFQLFCARFQTYFDAVLLLFVMCLLRINCLLQRCVHSPSLTAT